MSSFCANFLHTNVTNKHCKQIKAAKILSYEKAALKILMKNTSLKVTLENVNEIDTRSK